ncbi:hypothetical protein M3Y98_00305100 [Aphelenchoides besseyi]|nr:hypothetical protein M3Y98_00305100 [Aphelenchoides besseyi]KAI6201263.1 hypothetical protein M3Y96_00823200 [Aphelenchoides besseyi]
MSVKKDTHQPANFRSSVWGQQVHSAENHTQNPPDPVAALSDEWPKLNVSGKNEQPTKISTSPSSSTSTSTQTKSTEVVDNGLAQSRRGSKKQWKKMDIDITYKEPPNHRNPAQRSGANRSLNGDTFHSMNNNCKGNKQRSRNRYRAASNVAEKEAANLNESHDNSKQLDDNVKQETANASEMANGPPPNFRNDNRNFENHRNSRYFNDRNRRRRDNNGRNFRYSVPNLFQTGLFYHSEGFPPGTTLVYPNVSNFFVPVYPDVSYGQFVNNFTELGQMGQFLAYRAPMFNLDHQVINTEAQPLIHSEAPPIVSTQAHNIVSTDAQPMTSNSASENPEEHTSNNVEVVDNNQVQEDVECVKTTSA